jgi:hypothetical protein
MDYDVLGAKLRACFKMSDGRSVHPLEAHDAQMIDGLLKQCRLSELRTSAGEFYMAVGELQP